MGRHAIINKDGLVVNVAEWDGVTPWWPPIDHYTVESEVCDNGDTYDKEKEHFIKICNGKRYHKSCTYKDYIQGKGHIKDPAI